MIMNSEGTGPKSASEDATVPASVNRTPAPKSYVNMLDEFSSRRRLTPVYQLISMEGMCHEPTFVYKVNVDKFEAQGHGRKKLEARQMAAMNLLIKMGIIPDASVVDAAGFNEGKSLETQNIDFPVISKDLHLHQEGIVSQANHPAVLTSSLAATIPGVSSRQEDANEREGLTPEVRIHTAAPMAEQNGNAGNHQGLKGDADKNISHLPAREMVSVPPCRPENPVGSLQELTLSIRWPPPRFDLACREGAAHDAVFTIACFVWSYKSLGQGKSKKEAKRNAAYNMYQILRASPDVMELWQKRIEAYQAKAANSRHNRNKQTIPRRAAPLQDMHKDLMTSTCDSISALRASDLISIASHPDPLGFLQEIATEIGFDIFFDDLFDLTKPAKRTLFSPISENPKPSESGSVYGLLHELQFNENGVATGQTKPSSVTAGSLITLTLPKQVVCFGTGSSRSAARRAASIDALCYLYTAAMPVKIPVEHLHEPPPDQREST